MYLMMNKVILLLNAMFATLKLYVVDSILITIGETILDFALNVTIKIGHLGLVEKNYWLKR